MQKSLLGPISLKKHEFIFSMVLDDMPKRALRCVFDAMSRRQLISEKKWRPRSGGNKVDALLPEKPYSNAGKNSSVGSQILSLSLKVVVCVVVRGFFSLMLCLTSNKSQQQFKVLGGHYVKFSGPIKCPGYLLEKLT